MASIRGGDRLSDFTAKGEYKPAEELDAIAREVAPTLTPDQVEAMLEMAGGHPAWRDAVPIRTMNRVGFGLERRGVVTGFSRSGDGASPMTKIGMRVRDILLAQREAS